MLVAQDLLIELYNYGLNPTAIAVTAAADSCSVLAPAAGYAGRWADLMLNCCERPGGCGDSEIR